MSGRALRDAASMTAVAAVYFFAGKIGLSLAYVNASATAVWPPSGIALAAFLLLGYRIWPGVFLGAFLVNLTTAGGVGTSLGIAVGNTLEGVVGTWLVRRFAHGRSAFDHPHDVFRYAALAGLLSPALGATIGVTTLALGHLATPGSLVAIWLTWWLGDSAAILTVAPFLMLWAAGERESWSGRRLVEVALMFLSLLGVGLFVFGGTTPIASTNDPVDFLCFPPLIWAAFRFGPRIAATTVIMLSGLAVWGTLRSLGPFGHLDPEKSLLLLQAFMAVVSVLMLSVTAAARGGRATEARIRLLNEDLEDRVAGRTRQLAAANQELEGRISEGSRMQEELERSEARLREAQRVARVGSWEWEIATNVVWWSDELYAIYGLESSSFGASFEAFLERVHPDDRDRVRSSVETAFKDGRPFAFEHRIARPDGTVVTLGALGRLIVDEHGTPVRMMGTGQDITDRKRAEEERAHLIHEQAARREAEEANRLKDEFLATLSHELRTPLTAIVGWAHLLREGKLDAPMADRAVETINRNALIQSHLISDILDVSRMSLGRLELKRQSVDLATVIQGAVDTMRPSAQAKSLTLELDLEPNAPPLFADPERLQQVIWNLLSNAIKFTPAAGRIWISLATDATHARIRVEDDGPGIDPEFLPHVFERFRQRDASSTRRHGGLGLGLAIVRDLVELHDGSVTAANSERGRGSIFIATLPHAGAAFGKNVRSRPGSERARDASAAQVGGLLEGIGVLLVEDDLDSRELITMLLSDCGAHVRSAASYDEALAAIDTEAPEVLVSDIEMPGRNGYDLIATIRSRPQHDSNPAIALTAYASLENAEQAIRAGYQIHLSKPVQVRDLVHHIATLVRISRAAG